MPTSESTEVILKPTGFFIVGVLTLALGSAAILFPMVATFAVEFTTGGTLILAGILGLLHTLELQGWSGRAISVLTAIVATLTGVLMLFFPFHGVYALTVLVIVFLIASGILKLALAITLRPEGYWGWLTLSGLASAALGAVILLSLPVAGLWVLGLLVGIDLMMTGIWLILFGFRLRSSAVSVTAREVFGPRP